MGDGNTFDNKDNTVHNQAGSQVVYGSIYNNTFYSYDQDGVRHIAEDKSHLDQKLLEAAAKGETAKVEHLLDNGANVSAADSQGHTVLHVAASGGHVDIISILLRRGADKNARNRSNHRPSELARLLGHIPLANKLELNLL
ncbi:ankyrin repeat domain-containing protein [Aspergillus neoniger CBS 115656]|uniref:Ankyrin n=1 Tax=Aspergillus neoniger (strain CBS 115656) TaxID=1448310 RepID=A0A318Z1E9_ASPNB|nr:ankyrin [Aspergillus neoniger CBS 115656]PYH37680.1 ankyrin [Aspergillus neoniger CBS 115656]